MANTTRGVMSVTTGSILLAYWVTLLSLFTIFSGSPLISILYPLAPRWQWRLMTDVAQHYRIHLFLYFDLIFLQLTIYCHCMGNHKLPIEILISRSNIIRIDKYRGSQWEIFTILNYFCSITFIILLKRQIGNKIVQCIFIMEFFVNGISSYWTAVRINLNFEIIEKWRIYLREIVK